MIKIYKKVKKIDCPGRHGLIRFTIPERSYSCDVCHRSIPLGSEAFGCRTCNWDCCNRCWIPPDKSVDCGSCGKDLLLSSYNRSPYTSGWICDICRNHGYGERYFCFKCQYDLCLSCGRKLLNNVLSEDKLKKKKVPTAWPLV
eukprot:TRINITY_DN2765_c2_g2_i1.p1 TRINITY_DN2765_c2_g2~~TRINITY_DN2765_c2_g2_i1.p1  ORF type:complete len:143 (-),score=2.37 TRINITY_DN2765_c2_g2_i1:27-455(-)